MFNSKYNKFLTILLIIIIVAIIGILIFLGVRYYKKVTTAREKDGVIQQFDEQFGKDNQPDKDDTENNQNQNENENITLNVDENEIGEGNSGGSSGGQRLEFNGYGVLGKIKIPATGIEELILDKVTTRSIESAVAVLYGPGLNEVGNTVIVGHNYRDGSLFSNNKNLAVGDKIIISDESGRQVVYTVTRKYITSAQDFEYASRDTGGKREISLSTCTDDSNSRLIIWAVAD